MSFVIDHAVVVLEDTILFFVCQTIPRFDEVKQVSSFDAQEIIILISFVGWGVKCGSVNFNDFP